MQGTRESTIETAVLALSSVDGDFARIRNGVGWSGGDSDFGNSLAGRLQQGRDLTPKQRWSVYRTLRKYRTQLARDFGIIYDDIPLPEDPVIVAERELREAAARRPPPGGSSSSLLSIEWIDTDARSGRSIPAQEKIVIRFPYGRPQVESVKEDVDPSRRWDAPHERWVVDINETSPARALSFAERWGLQVDPDTRERLVHHGERAERNIAASKAQDAELVISGFGSDGFELRPFQRAGVRYLIENPRSIVGDEMGLGKTPQALAMIQVKGAYPALIVVPPMSNAERKWLREVYRWLPSKTVALLTGQKRKEAWEPSPDGKQAQRMPLAEALTSDVILIGYNNLPAWCADLTADLKRVRSVSRRHDIILGAMPRERNRKGVLVDAQEYARIVRGWPQISSQVFSERHAAGALLNDVPFESVVLDEAQNCKTAKAQRTRASKSLMVGTYRLDDFPGASVRLCTTGTPVMNRPEELIVLLEVLDMIDVFGGWHGYITRYVQGQEQEGRLEELHHKLRAHCFLRRTKKEVHPELPAAVREPVPIPLADRAHYEAVKADLLIWLAERIERDEDFAREQEEYAAGLRADGRDDEYIERELGQRRQARLFADQDKAYGSAAALVQIEALKQVCAQEKLSGVLAWVEDFLDSSDQKLIVVGTHQEINRAIAERFGADMIIGGVSKHKKAIAEERFQEDPEARVIVIAMDAASVAIDLTAASSLAIVELPWRPKDIDQVEGRAYGRENDLHGLNTYFLTAEDTIDEDIAELLDAKNQVIDRITDGKTPARGVSILTELLARLSAEAVRV